MNEFLRPKRLGEILGELCPLPTEALEKALQEGEGRIGQRLLSAGIIHEKELSQALAQQHFLEFYDLRDFEPLMELFGLIPPAQSWELQVLPVGRKENLLQVAVADPTKGFSLIEELEAWAKCPVELLVAPKGEIERILRQCGADQEALRASSEGLNQEWAEISLDEEQEEDQTPIVKLVDQIVSIAQKNHASDIHLENSPRGLIVKNRIDGVLNKVLGPLEPGLQAPLISRFKIMAELDIAEKRLPQDGRFKMRIDGRKVDFRVSILPGIHGEEAVIRILDKAFLSQGPTRLSLEGLGLDLSEVARLRRAVKEPYGMILIAGPTGSGKTTTLYAALSELDRESEKLITIEDPVEYQLDGITQIQVNEKKGLTFAKGLRSILRHDPDKIMVGEIRDEETLKIAVQSALTGHLVMTTVHANNALEVLGRFRHLGLQDADFATALNCVVSQRLVRKLCERCKVEERPSKSLIEESGLTKEELEKGRWYAPKGCEHCGQTGYKGRFVLAELLFFSAKIREMVLERSPLHEIEKQARKEGTLSMRKVALARAMNGETCLREINRVTYVE